MEKRAYAPHELKPAIVSQEFIAEKRYVVDKIMGHRKDPEAPHQDQYLVRWKDYTSEDDTWEPPESFDDPGIMHKYWRQKKKQLPAHLLQNNNNSNKRKRGIQQTKSNKRLASSKTSRR
ncbi:hypothetical protein O0I10_012392 [Lichtheimia ornata]|uniref:Chromo domain-containing protein n=1 Tax=Lichtheimia ornata TaxID=688661 RepID=A0AAD7XVT4_9FUNG|nr:uncharacterized protein O0I10_012392 [Lichtheimia ornata]KAJ8651997.1 hypothetical protein O0I10_012392 [Lichtheimia ornata]